MSFHIKCQYRDDVLITYAYVDICAPNISTKENCKRLERNRKLACLFDTGAGATFVDRNLLKSINAEPLPYAKQFRTGKGLMLSELYKVDICLPNHTLLQNTIVHATDTELGVIIGMDIISQGKLSIYHKKSEGYIRFDIR